MIDLLTASVNNFQIAGELTLLQCLARLGTAFTLTFGLSYIYKMVNSKKGDRHIMMQSIIFISVILAGAMMVIGNNLAIAFGLVGAVSIIRFRATVGNFFDMSFIFVAIVVGMASGLGFHFLACVVAIFVGALMIVLNRFRFGMIPPSIKEFEITVVLDADDLETENFYDFISAVDSKINFLEYKSMDDKKKFRFSILLDTKQDLHEIEKMLQEKLKDKKFQITILAK